MKLQTTTLLIFFSALAYGQGSGETILKHMRNKAYKQHFSAPANIETAMAQIGSCFTETGRNYFRSLPEKLAVLQLSKVYYMPPHGWRLHKTNHAGQELRKSNHELINYFIANGASGEPEEIMRLIV